MKRADFLILAVAASINVALWQGMRGGGHADHAQVRVGDDAPVEVSLHEDRIIEINGILGAARLQVREGAIRFLDSPCRHGLCLRQGWLRFSGESNACLPNGLSIRLSGSTPRFDSTNY